MYIYIYRAELVGDDELTMSTPGHVLAAYLRSLFLVFSALSLTGLVVSRVYIFYESYSSFSLKLKEEEWLRGRCQDADFYSNMRQHTDLCAQVETNARTSVLLHALNTVFLSAHMCGSRACMDYINDLVLKGFMWPALVVVCVFVIMIPSIITSMATGRIWHAKDWHARNLPYRYQKPSSQLMTSERPVYLLEAGEEEEDTSAPFYNVQLLDSEGSNLRHRRPTTTTTRGLLTVA
jgi:hypothetical protein